METTAAIEKKDQQKFTDVVTKFTKEDFLEANVVFVCKLLICDEK